MQKNKKIATFAISKTNLRLKTKLLIFNMKRNLLLAVLVSALLLVFNSCKKTDLTPAYIQINYEDINNCLDVTSFNQDHDLNYDSEQLASLQQHDFSHVNVYVNNKNLGCWKVPCKVSVVGINDKDSSTLVLMPCFKKNGMNNTIQGYPFLNVLRQKVMLKKDKLYKISQNPPIYKYTSYSRFPYLETFGNSSSFSPTGSDTNAVTFVPTIFEGRTVGAITLHGADEDFDVTTQAITLPVYNYYVYLEITYKAESNIDIGLRLSTGTYSNAVHQVGGVKATNGEWKTVYFDLSSVLMGYHNASGSVTNANLLLSGVGNAGDTHFYIDNIKIIYQPSA